MKKICSILLIAALIITAIPFSCITSHATTSEFAGGSGTENDPFLISTQKQLAKIDNYQEFSFKLINDIRIDLSEDSTQGWIPTYEFEGILDGNGYTIYNISIKPKSAFYGRKPGLFSINNGFIKNLTIENMIVEGEGLGGEYGGFIVTENNGTIINCHSKNSTIKLKNAYYDFGGIVGINTGLIQNCTSDNIISCPFSSGDAGGICARNEGQIVGCTNKTIFNVAMHMSKAHPVVGGIAGVNRGIITGSCNLSNITAKSCLDSTNVCAGGIVGSMTGDNSRVENCYNKGKIIAEATEYKGSSFTGGVVANLNGGNIINCYNTADVYGESSTSSASTYVGGLIGKNKSTGTIKNCYSVGNNSGRASKNLYVGYICGYSSTDTFENCYYLGIANNGSGYGDSSEMYGYKFPALKLQDTYKGFDFEEIWTMDGNSGYPFPELQSTPMAFNAGDVDENETVSVADPVILLQVIAGNIDKQNVDRFAADVDHDGELTTADVVWILRHLLGLGPLNNEETQSLLRSVLNGEKTLITENNEKVFLKDYIIGKGTLVVPLYADPTEYAFVDFDGDEIDELVINISSDYGAYLVLHCDGFEVYGYEFGVRALHDLKVDGSFVGSNGASSTYYCRLTFEDNKASVMYTAIKDSTMNRFELNGKECSIEEVDEYIADWKLKESVQWIKI